MVDSPDPRVGEEYVADCGAAIGLVMLSAIEGGDEDERARVSIALEKIGAGFRVIAEHAVKMGRPDLVQFFGGGLDSAESLQEMARSMMEDGAAERLRAQLGRLVEEGATLTRNETSA